MSDDDSTCTTMLRQWKHVCTNDVRWCNNMCNDVVHYYYDDKSMFRYVVHMLQHIIVWCNIT